VCKVIIIIGSAALGGAWPPHICKIRFLIIRSPECFDRRPDRHQGNLKEYYESGVRNILDDDRDSDRNVLVNG